MAYRISSRLGGVSLDNSVYILILVVQCASIKPSECGCLLIGFVPLTWKRQMNPAELEHSGGKTEELFHKMDFACHAGLSVMIDNSG